MWGPTTKSLKLNETYSFSWEKDPNIWRIKKKTWFGCGRNIVGRLSHFMRRNRRYLSKRCVDTTPYFLRISRALCFASSVGEDSRLTLTVPSHARIIRMGRGRSPNGATVVRSALLTWGSSLSERLQSCRFGEVRFTWE